MGTHNGNQGTGTMFQSQREPIWNGYQQYNVFKKEHENLLKKKGVARF